jgi:hypothetical protein
MAQAWACQQRHAVSASQGWKGRQGFQRWVGGALTGACSGHKAWRSDAQLPGARRQGTLKLCGGGPGRRVGSGFPTGTTCPWDSWSQSAAQPRPHKTACSWFSTRAFSRWSRCWPTCSRSSCVGAPPQRSRHCFVLSTCTTRSSSPRPTPSSRPAAVRVDARPAISCTSSTRRSDLALASTARQPPASCASSSSQAFPGALCEQRLGANGV